MNWKFDFSPDTRDMMGECCRVFCREVRKAKSRDHEEVQKFVWQQGLTTRLA